MAKNKDIPKDPIERLNKLLTKNFPNALKNQIRIEEENVIIEVNDLEISLLNDLFKKIANQFPVKIDELEDKIIFSKKNASELFHSLRTILRQSSSPKPSILHSFTPNKPEPGLLEQLDQERIKRERDEEVQRIMEYSNIPRKNLYTTDHEHSPKFIEKESRAKLGNLTVSLERYIQVELKNPNSHGHLWGLVGSDQVIKKNIAQKVLQKIKDFSNISISDPNYHESKKIIIRELNEAIRENKQAHGFWASLSGPGKLEKILIAAKETIETSSERSNKNRM